MDVHKGRAGSLNLEGPVPVGYFKPLTSTKFFILQYRQTHKYYIYADPFPPAGKFAGKRRGPSQKVAGSTLFPNLARSASCSIN